MAPACPEPATLSRLLLGQLRVPEAERLEEHLLTCPACAGAVRRLRAQDPLLEAVQAQGAAAGLPDEPFVERLVCRLLDSGPGSASSATFAADAAAVNTPSPEATQEVYDFLAPPEAPGEIGRLGPYRVRRVLGVGGMGVVFEAEDPQLHRPVALKTLRPALALSAGARQRFLREGQAAAALTHECLIGVYQVGEDRGVPYLAMPLLRGESLEQRLQRNGRLPLADVLYIGDCVARGLAVAHAHGLVHRDVKPANVWLEEGVRREASGGREEVSSPALTPYGVKILNFGLARAVSGDAHLSQSGIVVGTPAYMAPEQATGEPVDHRSDLFSLGCLLYRMCTGELPFKGNSTLAVLRALELERPRPPHALDPAVPPALSALVLRLLAKRPADRPASAAAVAEALAEIAARPWQGMARRRGRRWAAAALLLAGAALGGWLGLADRVPRAGAPGDPRAGTQDAPVPAGPPPCNFAPHVPYGVGALPIAVVCADFDGDGRLDLAVANHKSGDVSVLLNNGDGTFRPGARLPAGAGARGLVAGDFDGDGRPDLAVVASNDRAVYVFPAGRAGSFGNPVRLAVETVPVGLAAGDLNGDGRLDLVVTHASSATAPGRSGYSILLGGPGGAFGPVIFVEAPFPYIAAALADFDGDGKLDLALSSGNLDVVSVCLGRGDGRFGPPRTFGVGSGPGVLGVGDFNDDGRPDLAVENFGSNDVSVLLGRGDGTFAPAASYPVGQGPGGLAVADFNGDGRLDLAVANHNSNNVSILRGKGDGTFLPPESFALGWTPAGVAAGDFRGRGIPDLAVANYHANTLSVLVNRPPAPHFRLSAPLHATPGKLVVTLAAVDAWDNPDRAFAGAVNVFRLDALTGRPDADSAQAVFAPGGDGVATATVDVRRAGAQTLLAADAATGARTGAVTVEILSESVSRLLVRVPGECTAGVAVPVTVTAQDRLGNTVADYVGTVALESSEPGLFDPPMHTFVADDRGVFATSVTFRTPGRHVVTAVEQARRSVLGTATVDVRPAPAKPPP